MHSIPFKRTWVFWDTVRCFLDHRTWFLGWNRVTIQASWTSDNKWQNRKLLNLQHKPIGILPDFSRNVLISPFLSPLQHFAICFIACQAVLLWLFLPDQTEQLEATYQVLFISISFRYAIYYTMEYSRSSKNFETRSKWLGGNCMYIFKIFG